MSNIKYNNHNKRVRQILGTIGFYELEGDFTEVIEKLTARHKEYLEYTQKPHNINERWSAGYSDGTTKKLVKFDKISLECEIIDDDSRTLRVIGERDMLPEELAALEVENKKRQEQNEQQEKELFKKLAKKYGNTGEPS